MGLVQMTQIHFEELADHYSIVYKRELRLKSSEICSGISVKLMSHNLKAPQITQFSDWNLSTFWTRSCLCNKKK